MGSTSRVPPLAVAIWFAVAGVASALDLPPGAREAAREITAPGLAGIVRFLSSDKLEGRAPGGYGDGLTQVYLATHLEAFGLEPGAPGESWTQSFDVVGTTAALPPTWTFAGPAGEVALRPGHEYMAYAGFPTETVRLEAAEVVFAGYGITAPEYDWDDFEGQDVRGKVLLVLNNDPDWDDALFAGRTRLYYGRWDYKYEQAARLGAAGCILVHTKPSAGYGWSVVQSSWSGEQFELPAQGGPRLQVRGWVTEEAAGRLVALAGRKLEDLVAAAHQRQFRAVGLGVTTSFEIPSTISRKTTANVLGVLRGSDASLREQYVVFTAHHDHLGVGEPDSTGDRIYNGALDNASGVAQVLAIARAFAVLPERPRRSILFLLVGAEESGLLGSEHYARHPTVPPERIAAVLNYDGAQIFGRSHDIVQLGRGKTTIDSYVDAVAALQGRKAVSDLFPDRGFFYRSDHFSFARIGVPAVAFDAGMEIAGKPAAWGRKRMEAWEAAHYHRPSDEFAASWNLDGAVEDAQFGFYLGLALAQAPEMPAWTPGDEFEAARKGSHPAAGK